MSRFCGFKVFFILISVREELKAAVENKINPKRNGSEEGLGSDY